MKTIPVYLEADDWRSVLACLNSQISEGPMSKDGRTVWQIGKNRILYISGEIAKRLPATQEAKL